MKTDPKLSFTRPTLLSQYKKRKILEASGPFYELVFWCFDQNLRQQHH